MNQKYRKRLLIAGVIMTALIAGLLLVSGTFERRVLDPEPARQTTASSVETVAPTETVVPAETVSPTETDVSTGTVSPAEAASWPKILVDGAVWTGDSMKEGEKGGLRVTIALDGKQLLELPFEEAHTVTIQQEHGEENVIRITGEKVYMESANCDGQDCVMMGEVTAENLELRILGGFIVCLPHRLSLEVWQAGTP